MMKRSRNGWWVRGFAVPVLAAVLAVPAWGQDAEKKAPTDAAPQAEKVEEANAAASSYWLGILVAPADALLKTHLGIEAGVVVEQVVPESPAAKAGIQVNDILIQFGDAKLADVEALQKAVSENKDREAKLTLLRAGKQTTANVKPQVRPADVGLAAPVRPATGDRSARCSRSWSEASLGKIRYGCFLCSRESWCRRN